jgi:nitrate/nitrite transport system substrate-binding protein
MWFLTQHRRWGLLKEDPDYLAVATKVNQIALYKEAAAQVKVPVPEAPMRASTFMDGVVWDGKNPKEYAGRFKVRA